MFPFGMFHEPLRPFNTMYKCYSISMLPGNERQEVDKGGKIIMPPSALDQLTRLNIVYPMLFKLTNTSSKNKRYTHCGVLEFVADEGKIYLPYWMMKNLLLDEGSMVQVESAALPVATFSKFQPQSPDFLEIHNQKAVLENALRNFACLTTGDVIAISYNDKAYELCVLETRPGPAVSIIECDMNVEFATPVGYQEPQQVRNHDDIDIIDDISSQHSAYSDDHSENGDSFVPFFGKGNRLDGKQKLNQSASQSDTGKVKKERRGIPDYQYQIGMLKFIRTPRHNSNLNNNNDQNSKKSEFKAFDGQGQSLINKRK